MTTALAKTNEAALVSSEWDSKLDLIKRTVAAGATNDELQMFFHQAKKTGLDPLARQIYFVKRQGKGTIQVGIDGFRLVADRTGKYAGNDDYEFDDSTKQPKWAKATVYKMVEGTRCPFSATARWEQYFPGDTQGFMWKKMPHLMLGKCAEALALRKAFPAELSGVYTPDEMEQADRGAPKLPDGTDTFRCEDCGGGIEPVEIQGQKKTVGQVIAYSRHAFDGRSYCWKCVQKRPLGQPAAEVPTIQVENVQNLDAEPAPEDPQLAEFDGVKVAAGTVTAIYQLDKAKKKPLQIKMHDFQFSTFSETLAKHLSNCAGELAIIAYEDTVKGDKTYHNIVGIRKVGNVQFENNEPVKHGETLDFTA